MGGIGVAGRTQGGNFTRVGCADEVEADDERRIRGRGSESVCDSCRRPRIQLTLHARGAGKFDAKNHPLGEFVFRTLPENTVICFRLSLSSNLAEPLFA